MYKGWTSQGALVALLVCGAISGCGKATDTLPYTNPLGGSATSAAVNANDAPSCPATANVTPIDTRTPVGEGAYMVCSYNIDRSRYQVKTMGATSKTVCVYPMVRYSGSSSLLQADARQCVTVGPHTPTSVSFTNNTSAINYFIVVDSGFTGAMDSCLAGMGGCPSYASGSRY